MANNSICQQVLRPRWTGLYAARKRQKNAASQLPALPDTFLGWIPVLYKISEEQVLASAGLDAYVVQSSLLPRMVTLLTLEPVLVFLQDGHQIPRRDFLLRSGDHSSSECSLPPLSLPSWKGPVSAGIFTQSRRFSFVDRSYTTLRGGCDHG